MNRRALIAAGGLALAAAPARASSPKAESAEAPALGIAGGAQNSLVAWGGGAALNAPTNLSNIAVIGHGLALKRDELVRLADPSVLATMRAIKHALEPDGLLNPGKLV